MKKQFSIKWRASKQTRKQRKFRAEAPLHIKHKFIAASLSKELRKKYSRRSFPVRKGDNVKIFGGRFDGKTGKITEVDLKNLKVAIENVQAQKRDGTKVNVYVSPSKLQILELNFLERNTS